MKTVSYSPYPQEPAVCQHHMRAMLEILRLNKWMSTKALYREVGTDVTHTISRLRAFGHKIEAVNNGYSLRMTEKQEAALPAEVSDCGKVTMIKQGELK